MADKKKKKTTKGTTAPKKNTGKNRKTSAPKKPAPKTTAPKKGKNTGIKNTPKKPAPKKEEKKQPVPVGRTLKTKDIYLPYEPKKVRELKEKRWVAVIDKNTNEELAIVRLTDERQSNTSLLPTYKRGNRKDTYFKHFVETEDNKGNVIKVDGKKFIENISRYDLNAKEIKKIRNKTLYHSKQSTENKKKLEQLKSKGKKNNKKNPRD